MVYWDRDGNPLRLSSVELYKSIGQLSPMCNEKYKNDSYYDKKGNQISLSSVELYHNIGDLCSSSDYKFKEYESSRKFMEMDIEKKRKDEEREKMTRDMADFFKKKPLF